MPSDCDKESPDARWVWDGYGWVAAHSDGTLRSARTGWEPVEPRNRDLAHMWDPAWQSRDSLRLFAWLVVVPSGIALVVIGIWKVLSLDTTQLVIAALAGYTAWASFGGAIVRPRSRFSEVAIITAIVLLLIIALPMEWLAASDERKHGGQGQDIGAGIGIAFLYAVSLPPTLAFVAVGRFCFRLVSRSRVARLAR